MGLTRVEGARRAATFLAAALLSVVAMVALGDARAAAATLPATCGTLETQIGNAAASKGADTVVLSEMCNMSVRLPSHAEFTLEGAAGTTSGLNGEGLSGHLLESMEASGAVVLANLTFEHSSVKAFAGGAVYLYATAVTLSHDRFLDDTSEQLETSGGGAYIALVPANGATCEAGEPTALTVDDSAFTGDRAVASAGSLSSHGGGLDVINECGGRASYLMDDAFEDDGVVTGDLAEAEGGGVAMLDPAPTPGVLHQEGNVFDSDSVTGPAEGNRGGGGEWLEGINLTSVDDRFSRDSIVGTTGAKWSWGGGLGILNTSCSGGTPTESTLENTVVAGNSIGAGTPADLGGAGIYVGSPCGPEPEKHSHLRLLDSTVAENSVATAGGVAGIDGHPSDQLALENSIVASNPNGSELGGFTGTGGALTSVFSDVCDEAATAPLAGEGNICGAPELADEGNTASFDVHETEASPTIDAGSNALVPAGLGTDFYDLPRIAASVKHLGCETEPPVGPAVVDMGAAEYSGAVTRGPAPPCLGRALRLINPQIVQLLRGALKVLFSGIEPGKLTVTAKFTLTMFVTVKVRGHRERRRRSETITLGHAALTIASTSNRTITLTPSRRVRALLARHHRVMVRVTITYAAAGTGTGDLASTQTKKFTDVYRLPPRKKHHR